MRTVSLGVLSVSVPYLHKPKGRHTWHYRRVVPTAVRKHYSSPVIIKSLRTKDDKEAARACLKYNKQIEEQFDRLRRGVPKELAPATYDLAIDKLTSFHLEPGMTMDEDARLYLEEQFLTHIEDKLYELLPRHEFEAIWYKGDPIPDGLLDTIDKAALEIMQGEYRPCASRYPDSYVHLKDRQNDEKFIQSCKRAIGFLLDVLPDKPPGEYSRVEVRRLINFYVDKGEIKTATLHRHLTVLRAMFNKVSREHELKADRLHPFTDFDIPHLREDAEERRDFTKEELDTLRGDIPSRKPQIVQLIHLMLETGLRVNECCGLRVSDVELSTEIPYLKVQKNPFRPLKTAGSKRFIPLVGVALEAIEEAIAQRGEEEWLFDSYINEGKQVTKNTAASAAINKRLKAFLGENAATCHSFRHTFNSRLRNVECPKDIRDELGGWASSVSDRYGSPADIRIKHQYLVKGIDAPSGVDWS
jgi:integrase